MTLHHLAFSAALLLIPLTTLAQVVDTGSETTKATAAPADKTPDPPAASSPEEQRSRQLLQLKSERAAFAAQGAPADPQLTDINNQIATLQQQLAAPQAGLFSENPQNIAPVPPIYPRIVQEPYDYTPTAPTADMATTPAPPASPSATTSTGTMSPAVLDTTASAEARKALDQSVSLDAHQKTLVSVFDALADQAHANLSPNWAALQTGGIDKNTPVTITLNAVPAERALRTVLAQVAGATANLGYTIDEGVVIITTRDDLSSSKYQMVRIYNVRDFVTVDLRYPPQIAAQLYDNRVGNLMDLIKSTVAPDSWRDNGGTVGSIREFDGMLIVNQTTDNQRALEQMLAQLRAVR